MKRESTTGNGEQITANTPFLSMTTARFPAIYGQGRLATISESFMKFMHFMSKATDSGRESDGRCLRLTGNRLIMLHIIYICLKATFPPRDFTKAWAAKIFPNITAAKNIRDMTFPKSFMFLPGNYKYFFRKSALKCFSYIRRRSA